MKWGFSSQDGTGDSTTNARTVEPHLTPPSSPVWRADTMLGCIYVYISWAFLPVPPSRG